jgi:hypothetical protein
LTPGAITVSSWLVQDRDVDPAAQVGGQSECLGVVAGVDAPRCHLARFAQCHDRHDVDDADVLQVVLVGIVQDGADGRLGPAHHALHSVGRPEEVRPVYRVATARSDQHVLEAVGHPGHFVRHNLSDGEDGVVAPLDEAPVDFDRDLEVRHTLAEHPPGCLMNEPGRHCAEPDQILPPIVLLEAARRDVGSEHAAKLGGGHGGMRAERRHDIARGAAADLLAEQLREQSRA